jgi:ferredoxin, 2Fe-2S
MCRVLATDRHGVTHEIEATKGLSLMIALKVAGGLDVAADCGGQCECATCHVYVDATWLERLPQREAPEEELLDGLLLTRDTSRLACQITLDDSLDGLSLTLAPRE